MQIIHRRAYAWLPRAIQFKRRALMAGAHLVTIERIDTSAGPRWSVTTYTTAEAREVR